MKKLFIISAVLLATTSLKAQTVIGDTLKTNSQWVKQKPILPKEVKKMVEELLSILTQAYGEDISQ